MAVRPAFRKWLRIILPILVIVLGFIVWGDAEVRRFERVVSDLERRAPPLTSHPSDEDGARFYAAAAVLADVPAPYQATQTAVTLRDVLQARQPLKPEVADAVAEILRRNESTLALADRAAEMPLRSTQGRFTVLRSVPVWSILTPVMSLRTLDAVHRGDCDEAVRSLVAALRFLRGATADPQSLAATQQAFVVRGLVADLGILLQRCTLSEPSLEQIATALGEVFRLDDLQRLILGQARFRYRNVSAYDATSLYGDLIRPARYRVAASIAGSASQALDVAARPWPDRVRGMSGLRDWNVWFAPQPLRTIGGAANRTVFEGLAENYAIGVAAVNAGKAAVAVERYRQAHGDVPNRLEETGLSGDDLIDPFTGEPLRFQHRGVGYVVYSVGRDGRDDGGVNPSLDVGLSMGSAMR